MEGTLATEYPAARQPERRPRDERRWRDVKRLGRDDLVMAFLCGLGGALAYIVGNTLLA